MEGGGEPPWVRETYRRISEGSALRSSARGRQRWQALKSSHAWELVAHTRDTFVIYHGFPSTIHMFF